ncbi:MAG: Cytochrome c [Pseudomonadota bacterium]|jgi:mono/diheme cytochrome c family protein
MKKTSFVISLFLAFASYSAHADVVSAQKLADKYATFAKHANPSSTGLSASDGKAFYNREITVKGQQVACASCHTANPADAGKHIVTGKPIRPLAPSANPKRFADIDKVEKEFTDHCNDVIGRDCSAQEKGNFITYLLSIK